MRSASVVASSSAAANRIARQLSLAIALIVVGLLVWSVHWLLVERSLRADNPQRDAERGAGDRALYFTLVLAVLLVIRRAGRHAAAGGADQPALRRCHGRTNSSSTDLGASLATVVVTGMAWAYHVGHPPARPARRTAHRGGERGCRGSTSTVPRWLGLVLTALNVGTLLSTVSWH